MSNYKCLYYVHTKDSQMLEAIRDYLLEKGAIDNSFSIKNAFFRNKKRTKKTKVFEIDYDEMFFFAEKARLINRSGQIYFFNGLPDEDFVTQINPKKRMSGVIVEENKLKVIQKRKAQP